MILPFHICLNDYLKYSSNLQMWRMKLKFEARWSNITLLESSNMPKNIIKLIQLLYISKNTSMRHSSNGWGDG